MRDADEERNRHKVTRSRVRHVRDLACLQEHAVHLEKLSGWLLARTVLERHRIAEEMKGLRARAEDMNHRNLRYHLAEDLPASSGKPAAAAESMVLVSLSSAAEDSKGTTLGTTGSVRRRQVDLVPLICRKDRELRVIAVWGAASGGGGGGGDPRKTSVLRKAYDDLKRKDPDIVNRNDDVFESCAWVRVAHPFNPSEFIHCIVRQFYMNPLQQQQQGEEAGKPGEEQANTWVSGS